MARNSLTAREAAFLSLLSAMREESFISDWLDVWKKSDNPASADFHLAQEIAYGSCRMQLALEEAGRQLSSTGALNLKRKERALLYTALYQHLFLDRIPLYALVNESVAIAKRHCSSSFAKFLNALLRNLEKSTVALPQDDSITSLSIRFSFLPFLVERFVGEQGMDSAKTIMHALNLPGQTMARVRVESSRFPLIADAPCPLIKIESATDLQEISASPDYYIQNATPATLMHFLAQQTAAPHKILDLCSSPGGKLLAAHDLFPHAKLYANDVSASKIATLQENLDKYRIKAHTSISKGEDFDSHEKFDLIIIDAPCSNSGVLNKRPEARWRINANSSLTQSTLQKELIQHAIKLLSPRGEIWYMTCSILQDENEALVNQLAEFNGLKIRAKKTILPNLLGWDGGFGCALLGIS